MVRRYRITFWVSVLLAVAGLGLVLAACLWGILESIWFLVFLGVFAVLAIASVIVIRTLEHADNRASTLTRIYTIAFRMFNRVVPWWRLPAVLGSLNLLAFRLDLREKNLHNTSPHNQPGPGWQPEFRSRRTADGTYNDLNEPMMGSRNTRFARNAPPDAVKFEDAAALMTPSPREVSRCVMTRDHFVPATSLNLLAAAWIQFQNHDWFNHSRGGTSSISVPLKPGDNWPQPTMDVRRSESDNTVPPGQPQRFANTETHWWDASQIYGSSQEIQNLVRSFQGGKLKLSADSPWLPLDNRRLQLTGVDMTGFNDNWWVGLSLLHNLFTWEHNSICDSLHREYPAMNDERLFQTARLVNAALIAKIHTVEWTPGILAHPALEVSMNGNWWGLLGEAYRRNFGRLADSEAISGIMATETQHHTGDYYLTEEFVSVYRLHPLIPDDYTFRSVTDHRVLSEVKFSDIEGNKSRPFAAQYSIPDLFYSFGMMNPGAITLHNFPKALQQFRRIPADDTSPGELLDLATIDVLRDRERGVPRYNAFRKMLRLSPVKSFKKLTKNPVWARELEQLYEGDIDKVDLMVGMYAEPLPPGFGFSDTAFRVFILMASRRLKSDRFFTTDFTPQVYTQIGINWINENNMRSVLLRHIPELTPALQRSQNAFAPWSRVK